jgi:hypothetical protein
MVVGNVVSYDVTLDFASAAAFPDHRLVYFAIDVFNSSPQLSAGATPYSGFSFTLNNAPAQPLHDWEMISNFGDPLSPEPSRAEFDDSTLNPLPTGVYTLGTLSVSVPGVTPDPSLSVDITLTTTAPGQTGFGTQIGAENPSDPGGVLDPNNAFNFHPATFKGGNQPAGNPNGPAAAPEPSSGLLLFALAAGGLLAQLRWRRWLKGKRLDG